jgi:DNA gyrase inhibitor GyrI
MQPFMNQLDKNGYQESCDESTSEVLTCIKRPFKPTTGQRNVSFAEQSRCKRSLHLNEYTQNEIEAAYWRGEDYARIRQDIRATMDLIVQAEQDIDETQHCVRGLERCHPQAQAASYRWDAIQGVLEEQRQQRHKGIDDKDLLAGVYARLSHRSQSSALFRGLADAKNSLQPQNVNVILQPESSSSSKNLADRLESSPKRTYCPINAAHRQFLPPVA